jgi:uncharacterized membrane protein YvlD (DUF360 family)
MTATIERTSVWLVRLVLSILVTAIALLLTAWIIPGMSFVATVTGPSWLQPVAAAILIGLINLLLRPIVLYISRPLGFFLLFFVGLLLNIAALLLTAWLLPGLVLPGFWLAVLASLVVTLFNVPLAGLLNLGDDNSYFRRRTERSAAASQFPGSTEPGRKLVMLEIDGLSYDHLMVALEEGWLPEMQAMIDEEGYVVSRVDCGIPSQTSSCQAGIMFGDNHDIPAFRWYDKTEGRLIVSSRDARLLNERHSNGEGLMRGGSSVSNMLNGDAYKSLMTAADLLGPESDEARRRADDVYTLMLDPSFLIATLLRYVGMVGVELWEGFQQRRRNEWPRLNRLHGFYPFVRAATSVVLRDLGAAFTVMDILRGSPSIYVTWPGYDEVAHHSGPWSRDGFRDLQRYDKVIAKVRRTIKEKAPVYYDLIILSDHGQSFGPTFLQRYGLSIKEFIEQQLPAGTSVTVDIGGDSGTVAINSATAEFLKANEISSTAAGRAIAQGGAQLAERATVEERAQLAAALRPANVTAFGSGNLAQVYFDLFARKITLPELNAAYPGMVDALVAHEGIGLVCGYLADGTPVALSKTGQRNLHTGEVEGVDPLLPYAPETGPGASTLDIRAWQTRRVMDFPHAGDLMLISTVYPDGSVAALEELIGSHGGLGGEQTDAFIFHPPDMDVPETRNAIDLYHILNNHRGSPIPPPSPVVEPEPLVDWQPGNLVAGLLMVRTWLTHALRCLIPDREAFEGVVKDPLMTGPAVLIGVVGVVLMAVALALQGGTFTLTIPILSRVLGLVVSAVAVFGTGYLLTRHGTFARTFRAIGFAHAPAVLLVLALYQPTAHIVILVVNALIFIGVWMGTAVAHETKGWRTIILPLVYAFVAVIGVAAVVVVLGGAAVSLLSILTVLGLTPPGA